MREESYKFFKIVIVAFLFITSSFAQDSIKKPLEVPQYVRPILKSNPLPLLWGSIPLTSEWRIMGEIATSRYQASQIGVSYLDKSPVFKLFENNIPNQPGQPKFLVQGFRFQAGHKFYISKFLEKNFGVVNSHDYAPYGFYIGPHFSYSTAKLTTKYYNSFDVYYKCTHVNLNILAGYQSEIFDEIVFDIFTGFGYKQNTWIDVQNTVSTAKTVNTEELGRYYNSHLKIIIGINVGMAF